MLRLSVAMEEWLKIGEDINIVVVGIQDKKVKLMIDAPKEIPVARSRAREKYISVEEYEKEQRAIQQEIRNEKDGRFDVSDQIDLYQWITEDGRENASYAIIGKGKLARDCYNAIFAGGTQRILSYVNPQRGKYDRNIQADEESALRNPEIDYVVVAVPDVKGYRGLMKKLRDMGIPERKIFWVAKV